MERQKSKPKYYKGKTKKNFESILGTPIKNPVHQFNYRDDKVCVYINLHANLYKIELADTEEFKKLSKKIADAEKAYLNGKTDNIIINFSTRDSKLDEGLEDLIKNWLEETKIDLPKNWRNWIILILPLFRLYKLDKGVRSKLFDKYRQSQIRKQSDAINALTEMAELNWKFIFDPVFDARINGLIYTYKNETKEMDNQKAGKNKFLHLLIKNLFVRLEKYNPQRQNEIVFELYRLGKFDNYDKEYDLVIGANQINKIRTKALE